MHSPVSDLQVLVTHPDRQHSHQLVQALHEAGHLASYWTGVPATRGRPFSPNWLLSRVSPQEVLSLPAERVRHFPVGPVMRRLFEGVLPTSRAVAWKHRSYGWFDRWCARRLEGVEANTVVCYENSALETFREAKRRGWTTILDAASFHYAWQDRHYDYVESDDAHAAITRRKDREIELADHVLTVSELARESYLEGGVLPEQVTAVPVGCDLSRFQPASGANLQNPPFTFIFAGHASRRKGIDVLLEAAGRLPSTLPYRVVVAGGTNSGIAWDTHARVEYAGRVPQARLAELFRRADCLVLPSRHDSFGMVVVEAMATGLPVLVSDRVGAKEAIEDGRSGWVLPAEDPDALAEQMHWCITRRDEVTGMKPHAVKAAQQYTWPTYHERVLEAIRRVVRRKQPFLA